MNNMNTGNKVNALLVAEYFVDKANKEQKPLTNKKLQKLIYYAQAWSMVLRDKVLFDEKIEAWVHGPAVKSVYNKYKIYGFSLIKKTADEAALKAIPADAKTLLDSIWSVYGKFDADYLEMLTHSEIPWQEAREGLQKSDNSENEISLDSMRAFYSNKLKQAKS
jgi:uncharacterized phage-associated protein